MWEQLLVRVGFGLGWEWGMYLGGAGPRRGCFFVRTSVCMRVCVCACVSMCVCARACVYVCVCARPCTRTCAFVSLAAGASPGIFPKLVP